MLNTIIGILGIIPGLVGLLSKIFPQLQSIQGVTQAINIIDATQTDITNYDAGQAVVVWKIPQSTVPGATADGVLVAMQDGGAAYQTLFGSNS